MTFSDEVWEATAVLRKAIDDLPFLSGLADGTLPREDVHVLPGPGRPVPRQLRPGPGR